MEVGVKVLFLDIDGVLNRTGTVERCGKYTVCTDQHRGLQGRDVRRLRQLLG